MKIENEKIVSFETQEKNIFIPKNATLSENVENLTLIESIGSIDVEEGHCLYFARGNCLINKKTKSLVIGADTVDIPSDGSVTKIGHDAFLMRKQLQQISLPEGVTCIGYRAFNGTSLKKIVLPQSVESIQSFAFLNCRNLQEVHIGSLVKNIGNGAFCGDYRKPCKFYVHPDNPFYYAKNDCVIERETNKVIASSIEGKIPDGVTSIGAFAFWALAACKEIYIPASVKHIASAELPPFMLCGADFGGVTFRAPRGSYAIGYAKTHNIKYIEV